MKRFWDYNKVLILGLVGAVLIVVQQLTLGVANVEWPAVAMAAGVAAAGYVGRNWRGQTSSILGIVGNVGFAIDSVYQTGHFTWLQVAIQCLFLYIAIALPDGKSRGYEQSPLIREAKVQGELIVPSQLTNQEIKKEAEQIKQENSTSSK